MVSFLVFSFSYFKGTMIFNNNLDMEICEVFNFPMSSVVQMFVSEEIVSSSSVTSFLIGTSVALEPLCISFSSLSFLDLVSCSLNSFIHLATIAGSSNSKYRFRMFYFNGMLLERFLILSHTGTLWISLWPIKLPKAPSRWCCCFALIYCVF